MDDNTDASEDDFQMPPTPAPVVPVEIPNFPNLQNLPHFQVEEVPLRISMLLMICNLSMDSTSRMNKLRSW